MLKNKTLGSVLIVIGTAIGAGMLELPIASADMGFGWSLLLLFSIWIIAYLSAMLVLEVNLHFKGAYNNFNTMARKTLGRGGEITAWICFCFLLYALAAAYISGGGSLLAVSLENAFGITPPAGLSALIFTIVLGSFIFTSTRAVDGLNRCLFTVKGIVLILVFAFTMPKIDVSHFVREPGAQRYLWAAAPLFLTAFGFQTVIPSLSEYMGYNVKRLKQTILLGSLIPLFIYTVWQAISLGLLPLSGGNVSFTDIQTSDNSLGTFATSLNALFDLQAMAALFNAFFYIALATSFLGVTLGLFDFLRTGFKRPNNVSGRAQTALLTFVPPLIFAIYYPNGFARALGFASIFLAVLALVLPSMMAWKVRSQYAISHGSQKGQAPFQVAGGKPLLLLLLASGLLLITIELTVSFGLFT